MGNLTACADAVQAAPQKKWHPLLIAVCLFDAVLSLVIMRIILGAMGVA